MTPSYLRSLADRVSGATGADREIDRDVASAIGICLHLRQTKNGCQDDWGFDCDDCGADSWGNRSKDGFNRRLSDPVPAFSTSLDAAETLALSNWRLGGLSQHDHPILRERGEWTAWVYPDGSLDVLGERRPRCRHATSAARALTATWLLARANLDDQERSR